MPEKKKKKVKLSEREHPEYSSKKDDWEFYEASAAGGSSFITNEHLFTHRLEDSEDFEERLERAYYLNFCDTIPNIYNSYIFKEGVERPANEKLDSFRLDADGKGTNMSDFMKDAGYWSSVYGKIDILINMPMSKIPLVTKKDEKESNRQPYAKLIYPTQLKDWSLDGRGNYKWVVIEMDHYEDEDPFTEREESVHYMLITPDSWEIHDEEGKPVKFTDGSKNKGKNPLGYIPLYTMYHKKSRVDKIGESLLKDIVYVNRIIFNWCSCVDEQIERQTFSQLTVPDDGSLVERGTDILKKISTSSIWTFPSDAKHPPAFISPNVENINVIWKLTVDHIKEIFRLSGLQGGTSDMYTSRSGRQSQYNFLGVNSALAEKSASYQEAENQISLIALDYLKVKKNEYKDVQYPTTFDVQALTDEVDGIFKIMERNFSFLMNKELQKGIARKALPHVPQTVLKSIEIEIDEGDGKIEPIKGGFGEDFSEKNGQGSPNSDLDKSYKTSKQKEDEDKGKQAKEE